MEPIITVNEYPIGWEWLDRVPLEDFTWLIEIFSTITDNTDTYDFATFDKEATNGEPPYPVIVIDLKKHLKSFIQDKDQAEEMITQYTCYYNAIKRWESNHKETEILHQLEISNLLEQLKNN